VALRSPRRELPAGEGRGRIPGRMELRHLKYFLAVSEELNYRKAADRLNMTQPPLTRQIQELEDEIGAPLFERIGKRIKLTEAGEYLQRESRSLLDRADEIKRMASVVHRGGESRLRLGLIESAIQSFLPGLLAEIGEKAPDVSFDLFQMSSAEQIVSILHGELDAGIMRYWGQVDELDFEVIFDESLVAICSRKLVGASAPRTIEDLADLPFLALSHSSAPGIVDLIEGAFHARHLRPKVVFAGGQVATIEKLIVSGLGWSILPEDAIGELLDQESLLRFKVEGIGHDIRVGIAWEKGELRRPVRLLIEASSALRHPPRP